MPTPSTERVVVVGPGGKVGNVAAKDVKRLLREDPSYRVATYDETVAAERAEKYGSAKQQALAAAEGGARGLTVGLSDPLLRETLGADWAAEARARQAANPITALGSEAIGTLAPLLVSGGTSVGVRGALAAGTRGAGIGVRGAAALGRGAESAAVRLLGREATSLGGRAAQSIIPKAVGAAAEGAVYGAGQELSRSALSENWDHDSVAEKLLVGAGHGALIGGAAGGGLSALGFGGKAFAESLAHAASGSGVLDAGKSVVKGAAKVFAETAGLLKGKDPAIIEAALTNPETRELVTASADKVLSTHARTIKQALDTADHAARDAEQVMWGLHKRAQMSTLIDKSADDVLASATRFVDKDLAPRIAEMAERPLAFADVGKGAESMARVGGLQDLLAHLRETIASPKAARDPEVVFAALNRTKQALGRMAKPGKDTTDPFVREVRSLYDDVLKPHLEDASVYGERAAAAQRDINATFSQHIGTRMEANKAFARKTGKHDDLNPWLAEVEHDEGRLASVLRGVGTPEGAPIERLLDSRIKTQIDLLQSYRKHYSHDADKLAAIDKGIAEMQRASAAKDKALDDIAKIKAYEAWKADSHGFVAGQLGTIGAVMHGPVGAGLGLAAGVLSHPTGIIDKLAQIEHFAHRVDTAVGGGVRTFVRDALGGVAGKPRRMPVIPAAMSIDHARDVVERKRKTLEEWQTDPMRAQAKLTRAMGSFPDVAPKTADAMIRKASDGVAFLASKLPPRPEPGNKLTPNADKTPVSADAALSFARYDRAVDDPRTVVSDLHDGTLTREAVEAVRTVYPSIYAELQSTVMTECARAAERGKELPYDARVKLGMLLDVQTDRTLAPDFVRAAQAVYAAPPTQGPSHPRMSPAQSARVARRYETRTDILSEGTRA